MQTDKIVVNNKGMNLDKALEEIEKFAAYQNLSRKDTIHLRLLAEETIGMIRQLTGDFHAFLWAEGDSSICRINLEAKAETNIEQREELLAASTTGKNILAKGVMGKIREVMELSALGFDAVNNAQGINSGVVYVSPGISEMSVQQGTFPIWSLQAYRDNIDEIRDTDQEAEGAWDELEKSIVANLARDVQIGVLGGKVKMIVEIHFED
ncbi:MAG: hypothetical protein K6F35_01685 [Lachnospiraceae bacterium]|nr:hypothetical protein [Lachnospiraceae bacterium]